MPLFRKREKETEKRCIKCGAGIPQGANYCASCGSSQNPTPPEPPSKPLTPSWRQHVVLRDGEYIVETANEGEPFYSGACIYVLTNQRLIVLKREFYALDLAEVKAIKLEKEFFLQSIQDFVTNGDDVHIYSDNVEYMFNSGLSIRKDFREKIIQQKMKKPIVLDFSALKSVMEKGGIVLTTLSCPKCNGPIKMPDVGHETVCQYCGGTVYAQDVFKKLKTLLS